MLRQRLQRDFNGDYSAMTSRAHCQPGHVRTILEAMEGFRQLQQPHQQAQALQIEPFEILSANAVHGKLLLIAGHEDTGELEYDFTRIENQGMNVQPQTQMLSLPYHLMRDCARQHQCSFVIIDTNPFAGTWNQNLFLISDYFLIPCGADHPSKNGITILTRMILDEARGWLLKRDDIVGMVARLERFAAPGVQVKHFPQKVSPSQVHPSHVHPSHVHDHRSFCCWPCLADSEVPWHHDRQLPRAPEVRQPVCPGTCDHSHL